ncbi:Receptor-like protein 15 [Bienertia sinuspersici]
MVTVESCVEEERLALLAIKAYMQSYDNPKVDHPYPIQWYNNSDTNDCCKWDGVRCNVTTGRVTELDLSSKVIRDGDDDMKKQWLTTKSDRAANIRFGHLEGNFSLTSLVNLTQLRVLWISNNNLEVGFGDPSWRPKFQLQALGLAGCNLNKTFEAFPTFWSHQTNLSTLDLSGNNLLLPFPVWLFHKRSNLRSLYLRNNSFIGNLQLPHVASTALRCFDISSNNLRLGKLPKNIGFFFPRLWYLNLSGNHFEGPIPTSIAYIKGLQYLDLSNNNFSGELPRPLLSHCNSLRILQLSNNNIEGDIIPENMNLPQLEWMKVNNNRFGGTIRKALLNSYDTLFFLDVSNNNIMGGLPSWIGNFSRLTSLSMSQNNLQGQIPTQICNLQLTLLDLSQNNFNGSILSCPYSCPFSYMHLHNNSLSGEIPNALSLCTRLKTLDLSDNRLSGRFLCGLISFLA